MDRGTRSFLFNKGKDKHNKEESEVLQSLRAIFISNAYTYVYLSL